ncbi:hypothetical protein Tco_1580285, partial [Tanacetum coccineum]
VKYCSRQVEEDNVTVTKVQDDEVGDGTTSVVVFGLWKISGGSRTHY